MPPHDLDSPKNPVMKPNPRNIPTMFQIFHNVQYNVVQHKKYVKEMKKLYKKSDEESFRESFKNALQYLFTFGDTSANVDRVVQFVATFCTSLDDEEEFLLFIFDIIFNCQCVSGQSVRYRASQLLAAVLSALGDDACLDDDLCDKLLASQMQRLQDTRGAVRCRAALALQRLQNPMDQDDEVTRAYRFHMSCDPSSSVRRAVVMSIAKCSRNVPFVLERLCDVDEAVRRAAFLYIAAINVTQLRVRQRVLTLKVGLTERSARVRRVVEEILIPGWLSTFHGNIVDLLKAVRLDNVNDAKDSQQVAGKLLECLFKRLAISELLVWLPTDKTHRLIPAERLNKETAWYWRHLAEHLQNIDDDETLETVLPDLVIFIGYIKAILQSPCPSESEEPVTFSTRQYVLHELASMLRVYDAADQVGRAALKDLVFDALTGDYGPLSSDVIRAFVSALAMVLPEVSPRMEVISGIISNLREPPEAEVVVAQPVDSQDTNAAKLQRARLRVSLNVALEAQDEAVREENYALAEECKAKVKDIQKKLEELNAQPVPPPPPPPPVVSTTKEKLSDSATLNKCLVILNAAIDTPDLTTITPMLHTCFSELEVEIFQNPDVLDNALETVALYGMLDKEFAKDNKAFFFANLIDTSNERLVCTVLRCLVDLLCVHGAKVFEDDAGETTGNQSKSRSRRVSYDVLDDDGTLSESALSLTPAHSTVIELLLKIMDSTCSAYRLIIVEGLCRLFILGHLESPKILSRLLLLWFNPATVEEDMLRQIVGVFFQTFASSVEGAQEQIQRATIPTVRALAEAPAKSPLSEVDQEAVLRFLVSLTKVNNELLDSEGAMALHLCSYIVRRVSASETPLVCRLLALLSPPRDVGTATTLITTLTDLALKVTDKQSCRNLTRYLGALEASERLSTHKMSNTGDVTSEATMQAEESNFSRIGRITSSLPAPLARSTHVIINETVEEEVEIDDTSPTEHISKISEVSEVQRISEPNSTEKQAQKKTSKDKADKQSIETESPKSKMSKDKSSSDTESSPLTSPRERESESDSSGVSPVKKAKVGKGKKKKLSVTRKGSDLEPESRKTKGKGKEKSNEQDRETGGVKRSRSQRSVADVDRGVNKNKPLVTPSPPSDLDTSNVTLRRSVRPPSPTSPPTPATSTQKTKGKKTQAKAGKKPTTTRVTRRSQERRVSNSPPPPELFDDSDDTELHTIVYEPELVQSLLNDSSELGDSKRASKSGNITIPETPEGSEIDSEPEIEVKPKGKRNAKNK